MKNSFWNKRYSEHEYAYGEKPNTFFSEQLEKMDPGTIILPCDGEGRNAVYAASKGWKVNAFDLSEAGKEKALRLAATRKVTIHYDIQDATKADYPEEEADCVAFIYAHFPEAIRKTIHEKAIRWLKPGGRIILEAFNPTQLNNNSGGPADISMLYTEEMLRKDFEKLNIELLYSDTVTLSEGKYHQGKADVIRFVGISNL